MSIEIRQLLVKSNIVERAGDNDSNDAVPDKQEFKAEILDECRRLTMVLLNERRER